jgi:hypothetical protein
VTVAAITVGTVAARENASISSRQLGHSGATYSAISDQPPRARRNVEKGDINGSIAE